MSEVVIIGLVTWLIVGILYLSLSALIGFVAKAYEKRSSTVDGADGSDALTINRLRALDAITRVIWWAVLPFAGLVLGYVLPGHVREVLRNYISPSTLVIASLAAAFGFYAIGIMLRELWDEDLEETFLSVLSRTRRIDQPDSDA